jgi:hypothetical protein
VQRPHSYPAGPRESACGASRRVPAGDGGRQIGRSLHAPTGAGLKNAGEIRMFSTRSELEQRVSDLEVEVSQLKRKVHELATSQPWWAQIVGSFEDDRIYDEAMKLGRHYRQSL